MNRLIDKAEKHKAKVINIVPLERFGTPDEVVSVALFLALDEAAFVTDSDYGVDGGAGI